MIDRCLTRSWSHSLISIIAFMYSYIIIFSATRNALVSRKELTRHLPWHANLMSHAGVEIFSND